MVYNYGVLEYRESLMKIRSSTSEMNQEPDFFNVSC